MVDTRSYSAMTKSMPDPEDWIFDHGKELLNNDKQDAPAAGISSVLAYVVPGTPDKVISHDCAKRLDIDLIVCGAQGLNAIEPYIQIRFPGNHTIPKQFMLMNKKRKPRPEC